MRLTAAASANTESRQQAARGLVHVGTVESVGFVLDQARAAERAGDAGLARALFHSLELLTSADGAKPLFDALLGNARPGEEPEPLPGEHLDAVRKALRNIGANESVAELAANRYVDSQSAGRNEAVLELFDDLADPNMLASLAIRSQRAGSSEDAAGFLDRIGCLAGQTAVAALVKVGATESSLLGPAAERIYSWSMENPDRSQPVLYVGYLNDAKASPAERILAAYGLAGMADQGEAKIIFAKAVSEESDPAVRSALAALLAFVTRDTSR